MSVQEKDDGWIRILGATQHNLKGIDVEIPQNSLTVITGPSGSGKSSLAFDTLYAEGQRRYVESMSAYARQFLERINKPAVREIRGIRPAIAIRQKNTTRNPRSTVGTVTEVYDFLRLLYARAGIIHCRNCGREVKQDIVEDVVEELMNLPEGSRLLITFPFEGSALDLTHDGGPSVVGLKEQLENLLRQGFYRLVPDTRQPGKLVNLPGPIPESLEELRPMRVLVDRLVVRSDARSRLSDSLEMSYTEGNGVAEVITLTSEGEWLQHRKYTAQFECQHCHIHYRRPEPRLFSFNNPYGACPTCHGFGNTMTIDRDLVIPDPSRSLEDGAIDPFSKPRYRKFQQRLIKWAQQEKIDTDIPYEQLDEKTRRIIWQGDDGFPGVKGFFRRLASKKYKMHVRIFIARYRGYAQCADCEGERLRLEARDVYVGGKRISQLTRLPVSDLHRFFEELELPPASRDVAVKVLQEIRKRLLFLRKVGLQYLTLDRLTSTLSGGETQRIHLSASLGSSLVGTLYVLDEPSIGLHPRDQERLVEILSQLRDLGNTIVVVEHEREIIEQADYVIDMGPGAGEQGGEVIHQGDVTSLLENEESVTGCYLSGQLRIPTPVFRRSPSSEHVIIRNAQEHNLKQIDVKIPLGVLTCITGVSGSGKSTLVHDVLFAGLKKKRGDWKGSTGAFDSIEGADAIVDVLLVDQSPIGRTPRSNPVTYIKAFDEIRKLFAAQREAQARNLSPSHFSFNVSGGRCETCQGTGTVTVEMQFLADVELVCEDCGGKRFTQRVLDVTYRGHNIDSVLNMTVQQAISFFRSETSLVRKLKVLDEVGLGYLRLGQPATTLSGGEAQRIKLASYLSRKTSGQPLFIFDEPTTGLHFEDIHKLLRAFDRLISRGASLIVIEHNLDVIKSADWIIDLGPDGGEAGGEIVAAGTPEEVAASDTSYTGRYLRGYLTREAEEAV